MKFHLCVNQIIQLNLNGTEKIGSFNFLLERRYLKLTYKKREKLLNF